MIIDEVKISIPLGNASLIPRAEMLKGIERMRQEELPSERQCPILEE